MAAQPTPPATRPNMAAIARMTPTLGRIPPTPFVAGYPPTLTPTPPAAPSASSQPTSPTAPPVAAKAAPSSNHSGFPPPTPPLPKKPFDLVQQSILMMDPLTFQAKRYIDTTQKLGPPGKDNAEKFYEELVRGALFDQSTAIKWMRDHETNLKMSQSVVANKERDNYTCFVDRVHLFKIDLETHLTDDDIMVNPIIMRCVYEPDQSEFIIMGYSYISMLLGKEYYFASVNSVNDTTLYIKNMDTEQVMLNNDHPDGFKVLEAARLHGLSFNDIAKHFQAIVPYHRLSERVLIRDLYHGLVRMYPPLVASPETAQIKRMLFGK
jgi:hypothetical protein